MSSAAPSSQTPSSVWHSDEFDLDGYRARIGHTGSVEPTLATLADLQRAHVSNVPWDNVDMFLGRPAVLEPPKILDKIVVQRRGLTCEEHTTVFAAALAALGFHVECRSARVRMGAKKITGLSHAVVWAQVEGAAYWCDVGFGVGPLEPVRLEDGASSVVGTWEHRVRHEGGEWVLSGKTPDGWVDFSSFADVPRYPVDNLYTNHFLSTHPRSPFRKHPRASLMTEERSILAENNELVVSTGSEVLSKTAYKPEETARVFEEEVGVVLTDEDHQLITARVRAMQGEQGYNDPDLRVG